MKIAKVVPIFKSGDKKDPSNYRPISVLPALSKIFEKLVYNQLFDHFIDNNIFHKHQFGFIRNCSTADAAHKLVSAILESWDSRYDVFGVFCDLLKAFDCVEHRTLLKKLSYYGIQNKSLELIESYLTDRKQQVEINKKKSQKVLQ